MKSVRLSQLRRCNDHLKNRAWKTYQTWLRVLLRSIEHPSSKQLLDLLQDQRYTEMIELADCLSSTMYTTKVEHLLCNQLSAVIRKYPFPDGSVSFDPREKALKTFKMSEQKCKRVNKRFALYSNLRSPHEYALNQARAWIRYVLGDLKLPEVYENCSFGPGASVGVTGNATNFARKFLCEEWTCSPGAFHYARSSFLSDDHCREYLNQENDSHYYSTSVDLFNTRFSEKVSIVDYNKIAFVPKTAKVERTIAVEPLLNGFVQKGLDVVMRKRLTRVGIDLSDQTRNQRLAREGSLVSESDPYATIDLSSASDSISIGLCRYMLPDDWFDILNQTRSAYYLLDGSKFRYNKFTTMGNGFCFPLETLLFASLCHVAYGEKSLKPDFTVYGDDIIVRSSVAPRVLELLQVCGFKANPDKTFLSGPFRESCGADWFEGEDVRPITLDYAFDSVESIFKFCNLCRSKGVWEDIFFEANQYLVSLIPTELMFTRPYKGQVDTALEVPCDVFLTSPFSKWHREMQCWSWFEISHTAWSDVPITRVARYEIALMVGALTGGTSPNPFTERRKTRTKIRRISYAGGFSLFLPGSIPWKGASTS